MTIENINGTDVSSVWFDKNKKVERNTFHSATLKKAQTQEEQAAGIAAISRRIVR